MIKKSICLLLVACISIISIFTESAFAAAEAKAVNSKGVTQIEAESYSATTIDITTQGTSQLTYESTNPSYPNKGCIALVGIQSATYKLNVGKNGKYRLKVFTASSKERTFAAIEKGVILATGNVSPTLNNVSGASYIEPCEIGDITLSEGEHNLEIKCLTNNSNVFYYYFTIEALGDSTVDFSKQTGSYQQRYIPTVIQAEDFDLGAGGSLSNDGKNSGGVYRKDDGIDIYALGTNGYYIVLSEGEYTRYTFTVERSGIYALSVAAGTASTILTYFDDKPAPIETTLNGDEKYPEAIIANIYLDKGQHSIRVTPKSGSVKLGYIRFVSAGGTYVTLDTLNEIKEPVATVEKTDGIKPENPVYKALYVAENGNDNGIGTVDSPFATIKRAKDEIAKISNDMDGDIIVYIQSGTYKLDSTEIFGVEHSGKNGYNVILRGANIFNPPLISGGIKVAGWIKHTDVIWKAPLKDIDYVRNLYINSYPATRARSKYRYTDLDNYKVAGSAYAKDGFTVSSKNFPESFAKPSDLELVWNIIWESHRTLVNEIVRNDDKVTFLMKQPVFASNVDFSPGQTFYIENAMELLDEPGEFYYNKAEQMIYYYPYNEEDMTTADTYVGDTELMFKICGTSPQNKVKNLVFDNLKIRYGAYNFASEFGYYGTQADSLRGGFVAEDGRTGYAAQFAVDMADNIKIKNCEFSCLGSAAISMIDGVSNSTISGNIIRDISGTGIRIGTQDHYAYNANMEVCQNIDVTNNVLHRIAGEFLNNTAISVYYEKNINVCHNDISDTPYTGITAGWGWETSNPFDCGNINISNNRIQNAMTTLDDGGSIYTLGKLTGSTIKNNYLTKSLSGRGGSIYLDAGSSHMEVCNNVVEECLNWLQIQAVVYNTHELNVHDNFSDIQKCIIPSKKEMQANNIIFENPGSPPRGGWTGEAAATVANAGLEAPCKRLLSLDAMPEWHDVRAMSAPKNYYKSKASKRLGIIEAEDFMEGGEGIGYHKTLSPNKNNNSYRSDEVMLEKQTGRDTYIIGTNQTGEWLNYETDIGKNGNYYIDIEARQLWSDNSVAKIYLDDQLLTDIVPIPNTKGSKEWSTTTVGPFSMQEGTHIIRFEFISSFYFDKFKIRNENGDKNGEDALKNEAEFDEGVIVHEVAIQPEKKLYFTDTFGHWAEDTILEMAKSGLVNGIDTGIFAPDDKVTRSQSILLALRALKLKYSVKNWQTDALSYGIIETVNVNDEFITREEFADIIMKAYVAKYKKYKVTFGNSPFLDMRDINDKYINVVLGAYELSLMQGDDHGNFNPKATLTRAEATVIGKRLKR